MRTHAATAIAHPPFPARVNPYGARAGRESLRWAVGIGLVSDPAATQRLARADAGDLAGRACPDAAPDGLRLLSDLVTWLFALDDRCDEDGLGDDPARMSPLVAGLLDVLDLAGASVTVRDAEPVALGLHDLCRRLRGRAAPVQWADIVDHLRDYLLAMVWEAANRVQGRVPTVPEYVQMRRLAGAVLPTFAVTDLIHGTRLGVRNRADLGLGRLNRLAADLVCWCNDIFSYDKERREEAGHNLVRAIAAERATTEPAALAATTALFNGALADYVRLEARIVANGDPETARFAAARRCWIRGTYDWSRRALRYHS